MCLFLSESLGYDALTVGLQCGSADGAALERDDGEDQREDHDTHGDDSVPRGQVFEKSDGNDQRTGAAQDTAYIVKPKRDLYGAAIKLFGVSARNLDAGDIEIGIEEHGGDHEHGNGAVHIHAGQDWDECDHVDQEVADKGVAVCALFAEHGGQPAVVSHLGQGIADHDQDCQEGGDDGAGAAADHKEGKETLRHDDLCGDGEVLPGNLRIGQDAGGNVGHETVNDGDCHTGDDDAHGDSALGVLGDGNDADRTHRGTLTGPAHDGDGADDAAEAAVEKASVIGGAEEIRGVDAADAQEHEERQQQRAEAQKDAKEAEQADKPGKTERGEKKSERERVSMKEKLPEKKAEVAKNEANREHPVPSKTKETALG